MPRNAHFIASEAVAPGRTDRHLSRTGRLVYDLLMRTAIRLTGTWLGLSILLGSIWLVSAYPEHPSTPGEWACVFLLALPVQLAVEFLAHCLWRNPATRYVEQRTQGRSLSFMRIGFALVLSLGCIALVLALAWGWAQLKHVFA